MFDEGGGGVGLSSSTKKKCLCNMPPQDAGYDT